MNVDLHFHTCVPGRLRASALLDYDRRNALIYQALQKGLDGICLTEHDRLWEADAARALYEEHGLPVFRGMEVTTNYTDFGHVLVYGLERYVPGIYDVNKLAEVVRQEGAVMYLAHPFREVYKWNGESWMPSMSVTEATGLPVMRLSHGLEVFNGETLPHGNEFARRVCHALGLPAVGGSDAHYAPGVGNCVTEFERTFQTQSDLLDELRSGRFEASDRRKTAPASYLTS